MWEPQKWIFKTYGKKYFGCSYEFHSTRKMISVSRRIFYSLLWLFANNNSVVYQSKTSRMNFTQPEKCSASQDGSFMAFYDFSETIFRLITHQKKGCMNFIQLEKWPLFQDTSFEMVWASFCDAMGMIRGWIWDDLGMIWKWFWDDLGMTLGWSGDDLGMILVWFWLDLVMIWGWFGDDFGLIW